MATTPSGWRPRTRPRLRPPPRPRRRSRAPLPVVAGRTRRVEAWVAGPDAGPGKGAVHAARAFLAAAASEASVLERVAEKRRQLLPAGGRALAGHKATLDVGEVRRGRHGVRLPGRGRQHDGHDGRPEPAKARGALVAAVLRDRHEPDAIGKLVAPRRGEGLPEADAARAS